MTFHSNSNYPYIRLTDLLLTVLGSVFYQCLLFREEQNEASVTKPLAQSDVTRSFGMF